MSRHQQRTQFTSSCMEKQIKFETATDSLFTAKQNSLDALLCARKKTMHLGRIGHPRWMPSPHHQSRKTKFGNRAPGTLLCNSAEALLPPSAALCQPLMPRKCQLRPHLGCYGDGKVSHAGRIVRRVNAHHVLARTRETRRWGNTWAGTGKGREGQGSSVRWCCSRSALFCSLGDLESVTRAACRQF